MGDWVGDWAIDDLEILDLVTADCVIDDWAVSDCGSAPSLPIGRRSW